MTFLVKLFYDALCLGRIFSDPVKHLECILKIRTTSDCPVDGGWTRWGEWENCQGQCGQVGHQIRKRLCTNPTPHNDGYDCRGKHEEMRSCQILGTSRMEHGTIVELDDVFGFAQLAVPVHC